MLFDGLSPIVCGVLGYVSIILYDLNNTSHNNDRMQSLHTVGAGLIGLAFFSTVLPGLGGQFPAHGGARVIAGILALGFFRAAHIPHPHRRRAHELEAQGPQKTLVGKGSRDDGSLRSLPPSECLGDALFSVCCSFRRRTLIRGAPPLSACAVCC